MKWNFQDTKIPYHLQYRIGREERDYWYKRLKNIFYKLLYHHIP